MDQNAHKHTGLGKNQLASKLVFLRKKQQCEPRLEETVSSLSNIKVVPRETNKETITKFSCSQLRLLEEGLVDYDELIATPVSGHEEWWKTMVSFWGLDAMNPLLSLGKQLDNHVPLVVVFLEHRLHR